jgi:hypothetical protein
MLVLLDQTVEQVGISTSKSTSDLRALLRHRSLKIEGSRVHPIDTYASGGKKDAREAREARNVFKGNNIRAEPVSKADDKQGAAR